MKRKVIFFAMLLALTSIISTQSCKKPAPLEPVIHNAFTIPSLVSPSDGEYVHISGTTIDLKWSSTNASGDPVLADVYLGTSESQGLFKAGQTSESVTVTVTPGLTYFWHVQMKDANGIRTDGPTWSFNPLCVFTASKAVGSYHSVSPPSQWNSEGDITITADPNDPYKVYVAGLEALEGVNENGGPLVMHIDPVTFNVTADKTILATDAFGYTNLAYAGTGTYNGCDGSYAMEFDISVDEGDFGTFSFTFTRN